MSLTTPKDRKVARGILKTRSGWRAVVRVNGKLLTKRFPPTAPIQHVRRWRDDACISRFPELPKAPAVLAPVRCPRGAITGGQCYIYFILSGDCVKIGRAASVTQRLGELQTAHHQPLQLVGYVIGAESLERELHAKFWHLHERGEWFRINDDLSAFIASLPSASSDDAGRGRAPARSRLGRPAR